MDLIKEGAELLGESGKTYLAVSPLGQANVWTAVEKANLENLVVLKTPGSDDTETSWPRFQHEMVMHELLKDCSAVRKQVDRIPPVKDAGSPPILVLEIFETTLWQARTKRPFTKPEVRSVARQTMRGLNEVHENGLVYADLKMQNVMLNGFDTSEPGDLSKLVAKLGDLGIVMYPSKGTVQPVAYRAPEVFFKGAITQAADIWGFGLIYCHLLEAIERFDKTGLYDDLYAGGGSMPEREQAIRYALANDYDIENVDYYKDCALPYRSGYHQTGNHWEELRKRGLDEEDVEFLQWILKSDPRRRPSAQAILDSDVLNATTEEMANGNKSGQLDGLSGQEPHEAADTNGPAKRQRRDEDSQGPATMATVQRPEALLRGASQAVSTPGIATPGNSDDGYMLHKRNEHISPILEHPLVQSVVQQSLEESKEGTRTTAVEERGAGEADNTDKAVENAVPAPEPLGGIAEVSVTPDTEISTSNDTARPEGPSHLGTQSSSGGTWLSYR